MTKPRFTAELGTNWRGDFETLERMVKKCAEAGIAAVKLQALSEELIKRHSELAYYRDSVVNEKNIKQIDKICSEYGIFWYATVMEENHMKLLHDYTSYAKIRHADSSNDMLIGSACDYFERVFVSSSLPLENKDPKIVNLYCIPQYPTEYGSINFEMITRMDGYSNHCLNPLAIFRAARLGAKYIEFHITDSREEFALDNKVSLIYEEVKEVLAWIR